jgi:hypothetical protein
MSVNDRLRTAARLPSGDRVLVDAVARPLKRWPDDLVNAG